MIENLLVFNCNLFIFLTKTLLHFVPFYNDFVSSEFLIRYIILGIVSAMQYLPDT